MTFTNKSKSAVAALRSVLFGAILALAASCGQGDDPNYPAEAVIQLSDQFTGEFDLVDMHGAAKSNADFAGGVQFVYFGFASCPDVCPLALGRMTAALNELSDAERAEVAPLFISVDPERDTPEALRAFLAFDERILGLTGDEEAAAAARAAFKTYAEKRPLPDSALGYTMDHYSLFYVVDRAGQPRIALPDSLNAVEIASVLRAALEWR